MLFKPFFKNWFGAQINRNHLKNNNTKKETWKTKLGME